MSTDEDNNKKGPNFNAITVGGLLLAAGGLAYWWFTKKNEAAATVSKITKNKLVLCGAPGSGKGTQCEILRNNYGMVHLSTGDLLRVIAESGTEEGNKIKEIQSKGGLVPDHIVIDIVKKELAKDKAKEKGWILDGFPRTVAQAEALTAAGLRPDNVVPLKFLTRSCTNVSLAVVLILLQTKSTTFTLTLLQPTLLLVVFSVPMIPPRYSPDG